MCLLSLLVVVLQLLVLWWEHAVVACPGESVTMVVAQLVKCWLGCVKATPYLPFACGCCDCAGGGELV